MGKKPVISFEFFPPRDAEGRGRLIENVAARLGELKPAFFSVTYGAGGTTRDGTRETIKDLLAAGHDAARALIAAQGSNGAWAVNNSQATSYAVRGLAKFDIEGAREAAGAGRRWHRAQLGGPAGDEPRRPPYLRSVRIHARRLCRFLPQRRYAFRRACL